MISEKDRFPFLADITPGQLGSLLHDAARARDYIVWVADQLSCGEVHILESSHKRVEEIAFKYGIGGLKSLAYLDFLKEAALELEEVMTALRCLDAR